MRQRSFFAFFALAAVTVLFSGCTKATEGRPPADLNGFWFGSWSGEGEFGEQIGSGFYVSLVHDESADIITGTAFSSIAGLGTVNGTSKGSRFTLDITYPSGDVEQYTGREAFGTVEDGDYEGTVGGAALDGEFGMFPAELAASGSDNTPGGVSGTVTTAGGTQPLAGAVVSIGVGDDRQETVTNASGNYTFAFVEGGPRVLVVTANGGESAYVPLVVDSSVTMPSINITTSVAPPTVPAIDFSQQVDGVSVNNSVVFAFGSVTAIDAPYVVASINGGEFLVPLNAGAMSYPLILSRGVNTIVFQAINQVGVTERTALVNADILPQKVRVTLVWDQGSAVESGGTNNDQDLHVWQFPQGGGTGNHCYYADKEAIAGGVLDLDNVFGFGPENFTMTTAPSGKYYVAVNYFGGSVTTNVIVRVSLNERTPNEQVFLFGPRLMVTPGSPYPVTVDSNEWWRVVDINVDASGVASLAAAPNPDTAFALPQ